MTLDELLVIMRNRLMTLQTLRANAVAAGDLQTVLNYDADISTTQSTINQMESLPGTGQ